MLLNLLTLPKIEGDKKKQVPFSIAIENVEFMH